MSTSSDDPVPGEAAVLQSMTLLATLQTAVDVWQGVEGRRAGCDPSAQEPPEVTRPYLRTARQELDELWGQLLAGSVLARQNDEPPMVAAVRRFDVLMKLGRVERLLHGTHQRLLSLYPAVSEDVVEAARLAHQACASVRSAESENFLQQLHPFLAQVSGFLGMLEEVFSERG